MAEFETGNLIRLTATWETSSGTVVDPDNVFLQLKNPNGVNSEFQFGSGSQIVKSDTGIYYHDLNLDTPGKWFARWRSTGSKQAAVQTSLRGKTIQVD